MPVCSEQSFFLLFLPSFLLLFIYLILFILFCSYFIFSPLCERGGKGVAVGILRGANSVVAVAILLLLLPFH